MFAEVGLTLARNNSAAILIFDGEPVAGRALGLLLRTAGYDATYVTRDCTERATTFDGIRIVLLGPRWDANSRAAAEKLASARRVAITPILEIGTPRDGAPNKPERFVPWPCHTEDLIRRIDVALLGTPEMEAGTKW
jgi:hypothetical protein